jgi:hypothetical protein
VIVLSELGSSVYWFAIDRISWEGALSNRPDLFAENVFAEEVEE